MERFDIRNLASFSTAARELLERTPGLEAAIELARAGAAAEAERMTKAELAAALDGTGTAQAKRTETALTLAKRYADHAAKQAPEHAELARLTQEAARDDFAATQLNGAMDAFDALAAKFSGANDMAYTVEWHGDEMITAKYLARYALSVRAGITNGGLSLREAVLAVAHDAMFSVLTFPRGTSDLRPNGHGMDIAAQARAAADFIRIAVTVLGDTVPVSLLKW
jgi:hypothetical protein